MHGQTTNDILSARLLTLAQAHVFRLTVRGPKGKGLCCFHKEDTPSLSFDFSKGVFFCFGCGKGGGVKDFALAVGEQWGTIRYNVRDQARFAVQARRRQAEEQARAILERRKEEREAALWTAYFEVNNTATAAAEVLALFHRRPDLADEFSPLVTQTESEYGDALFQRSLIEARLAGEIA